MGCHFLLQRISQTQGSNPRLLCLLHRQAGSLPLVPPGSFFILTLHPCCLSGVIKNIFWLIFILWVRSETTYFCIYLSFSPIILQLFCRESRQNLLPIANIILFFHNSTESHQYLIQWSHEPGELSSSRAVKEIRPLSLWIPINCTFAKIFFLVKVGAFPVSPSSYWLMTLSVE